MSKLFDRLIFWQVATLLILVMLFFNPISHGLGHMRGMMDQTQGFSLVTKVEASEIYPMFTCPCCGQPLNKVEPCCGAMIQMIDYIDQQLESGAVKDDIILATAKEFGIDRLTSEEDRLALKQKLAELAPEDAPKIVIDEVSRDLGEVSQSDGVVSADFDIKNQGKSDLVIDKLSSSCGCTSATIVYQNEEGPTFTMAGHGQENPTDWQVAIKPGDLATLRIYYDPTVHPDLVGAVTRTVSVFSNDPVEFETTVTITLEQTI